MAKFRLRRLPKVNIPSLDAVLQWQEQQKVDITIHMPDKDGIRWIDAEPMMKN